MKITTKQITMTAALLAICIVSQLFKNTSVYITGPIINTCIIIAVLNAGLISGVILSVITPVTSFFITGSPIVSAIPLIMPCIMIGNVLLAVTLSAVIRLFLRKENNVAKLIKKSETVTIVIGMISGSVVKAIFMGGVISNTLIPMFIPEKMMSKMAVFQATFSVTQLITALIGSVFAFVINTALKKIEKF